MMYEGRRCACEVGATEEQREREKGINEEGKRQHPKETRT